MINDGFPILLLNTGRLKSVVGEMHGNGGLNAAITKEAPQNLKIDITNPLPARAIYFLIPMPLERGRFRAAHRQQGLIYSWIPRLRRQSANSGIVHFYWRT
jgi:hypothetical protein